MDIKRIAYDVAKARILLIAGDVEGAQALLDDAASLIPESDWPQISELERGE